MSERKRKKKNKLRGNRTFGSGDTKNRRGSGTKGGKGRAGSKKHKFSKYYLFAGTLRKFKAKPKGRSVNLEFFEQKLSEFTKKNLVETSDGFVVLDGKKLGVQKILGAGEVHTKFFVKNFKVSKSAQEKILKAGGKIDESSTVTQKQAKELKE